MKDILEALVGSLPGDTVVVFRVGSCGLEQLQARSAGSLGSMSEDRGSGPKGFIPDQVQNDLDLSGGDTETSQISSCFHIVSVTSVISMCSTFWIRSGP